MHLIYPPEDARALGDAALEDLYRYPDPTWLAVSFVQSADGAVEVDGRSAGLSTPPDRRIFALGSDLADVILLGARTAVGEEFHGVHPDEQSADRRRRRRLRPVPPIAIVSGGSLPPDAPALTDVLTPTIVLTCAAAPHERRSAWVDAGATVVVAGADTVDLPTAVRALHERGLHHIDAEGGPRLFAALLAADLVDELRVTLSPVLVAGAAERIAAGMDIDPAALSLASVLVEDDTLLMRYLLPGRKRP